MGLPVDILPETFLFKHLNKLSQTVKQVHKPTTYV